MGAFEVPINQRHSVFLYPLARCLPSPMTAMERILLDDAFLQEDVYNGMLGTLMKNLAPAANVTVQIVAFTPQPRLVKLRFASQGADGILVADQLLPTRRYLVKPELGLLASLLVMEPAPMQVWIVDGLAPGFLRFQGPLYFLGPVWRIELN